MTTLTSAQAATAGVNVHQSAGSGVLYAMYGVYELTANPTAADIIVFGRVPANARIVGGWMYADDIDTDATEELNIDLGWAANGGSGTYDSADPDGLGNFGVFDGAAFANPNISSSTGNVIPFSGVFADGDCPMFTRETTIQAVVNVDAATFTAGAIAAVVLYIVEGAASSAT